MSDCIKNCGKGTNIFTTNQIYARSFFFDAKKECHAGWHSLYI